MSGPNRKFRRNYATAQGLPRNYYMNSEIAKRKKAKKQQTEALAEVKKKAEELDLISEVLGKMNEEFKNGETK